MSGQDELVSNLRHVIDNDAKEMDGMLAKIAELEAKNAELNGYLDAIAAIPEVDAAEGDCDEAVRNAIAKLRDTKDRDTQVAEAMRDECFYTWGHFDDGDSLRDVNMDEVIKGVK